MKRILTIIISLILVFGLIGCTDDKNGKISIIFDTRGGNEIETVTCENNDRIDLPTPVRDDAMFMGWYADTSWEHKVNARPLFDSNTVLYARWAVYQVVKLNSSNYEKYLDISVSYLYTEKNSYKQDCDYCQVKCTAKECIVQDGKNIGLFNGERSYIEFYVKGVQLYGEIDGKYWRYSKGQGIFDYFIGLSDIEKVNGLTIYNVSGTLRAYVLED